MPFREDLHVTNAFRLRVWLGPGNAWAWTPNPVVTNAFRLRVWLGHEADGVDYPPEIAGHQCLSAESLVRTISPRAGSPCRPHVTNAFRLRVWLGHRQVTWNLWDRGSHQCLSAESLVRTCRRQAARPLGSNFVTNAFRLRVWLGRAGKGGVATERIRSPMPFG